MHYSVKYIIDNMVYYNYTPVARLPHSLIAVEKFVHFVVASTDSELGRGDLSFFETTRYPVLHSLLWAVMMLM